VCVCVCVCVIKVYQKVIKCNQLDYFNKVIEIDNYILNRATCNW